MTTGISTFRTYALRLVYLLNFIGLGSMAWPYVLNPPAPMGLVEGAAYSFWAAFALLTGLGLRYPLQMLPLLFIQLTYKIIWLLTVALPIWSAGHWDAQASGLLRAFTIPVVIDLIVIPWAYVYANYVRKAGDSWRFAAKAAPAGDSR